MRYQQTAFISSEMFQCDYAVGRTEDGKFVYVWSTTNVDEIDESMITDPEAFHGAVVGTTKEEVVWEIENCVGSFRWAGDPAQQEEAETIVETLLEGLA